MKKMKKFLLTALAALVTFSSCGGALADTELPYTTYNYDYWGYIVYTPAAYVPAGSITGASFQYNGQSLGAFKNPQDLCVAQDGTVYLADSGNNRIVLLSSDMTKVVRVIPDLRITAWRTPSRRPRAWQSPMMIRSTLPTASTAAWLC